ncbi:unnamed protein product [Ceutorhynchus assimilis]|uniref:ITPR-interacting domain-containing protein n=1 Tax=Ceutorhynchus assimilis TaxID=467358 RepID=A0A9N9MRG0_9CUCU|nr:unnamed protein product [Ceutorhynchus assimilis]
MKSSQKSLRSESESEDSNTSIITKMLKSSSTGSKTNLQKENTDLTQKWLETLSLLKNHQINQTRSRSSGNSSNTFITQQSLNKQKPYLLRDCSFQSDDSQCSSIESVLELRKPDPEEVLLGLGFGPKSNLNVGGRIPARFLQPSKLITHIDINKFLEQYGENYCDLPQSVPPSPAKARPKSH